MLREGVSHGSDPFEAEMRGEVIDAGFVARVDKHVDVRAVVAGRRDETDDAQGEKADLHNRAGEPSLLAGGVCLCHERRLT